MHVVWSYSLNLPTKAICVVSGNLALGGPAPIGARKANLSQNVEPYMQEIALSEQVSMLYRLMHFISEWSNANQSAPVIGTATLCSSEVRNAVRCFIQCNHEADQRRGIFSWTPLTYWRCSSVTHGVRKLPCELRWGAEMVILLCRDTLCL